MRRGRQTTGSSAPVEGAVQHGGTPRALLAGLIGIVFLCLAAPYTDLTLQGSELAGNHLPLGTVCFLLVLLGLSALGSRFLRRWRRFSGRELLVAFAMTLAAAGLPTFGLAAYLFPIMSAPIYYATPENRYAEVILPNVPSWLVPKDVAAVRHFYLGLPPGAAVPWGAWLRPLALWSVLALAVYLVMICLSVLVADQWIRRERLAFPLAQVPLEVSLSERWYWRDPLLWLGAAIPLVLHTLNGLHRAIPELPEIRLKNVPFLDLSPDKPLSYLRASINVYFSVIAVAYLLPAEISFSIPFFYFVHKFQFFFAYVQGADLAFGSVAEAQYVGAFLAFVIMGLWVARPHFREVVRLALQGKDPRGWEYRWAMAGLVVGLAGMVIWLRAAGVRTSTALAVAGLFVAIALGLGRLVVETGALFAKATQMRPLTTFEYLAGTSWLRTSEVPIIGVVQYVFMYDLKTFAMPALAHAHKLGDAAGIPRPRLVAALALALVTGMVASYASLLWMAYHHGAVKMSPWFFVRGPTAHLDTFVGLTLTPRPYDMLKAGTAAAGAAFVFFLLAMRQRFLWWPFHPCGYILAYSSETVRIWFPFLAGWLCKTVLIRIGGLRLYRHACRFFWGLLLGEFAAAALWLGVSAATGLGGYAIFP